MARCCKAYGSPRIYAELRTEGRLCSVNRVARIMRKQGIAARRKPRYIVTTESGGTTLAAPDLLNRRFRPGAVPAWVADLTYVSCRLVRALRRFADWFEA